MSSIFLYPFIVNTFVPFKKHPPPGFGFVVEPPVVVLSFFEEDPVFLLPLPLVPVFFDSDVDVFLHCPPPLQEVIFPLLSVSFI